MASNRIYSNESKAKLDNTEESEHSADNTETQLDTSVTHGSDQVQEMYCEECEKHDNKYVPASGFCVDCVEYKCALCINYHKRHFRNHSLQDQDDMPQDFYLVKCTKHAKELIKFYCFECENLACPECRNSDHKTCSKIQHLPSLVKDVEQSKEFIELQDNLDTLSNNIEKVKDTLKAKANISFTMEAKAKATIKEHKEQIINAYNQHQKKVTDEFDKKMEETIAKLKLERKKLIKSLEENQKTLAENLVHSETDVVKRVKVQRGYLKALEEKTLSVTRDLKSLSGDLTQTKASGEKCRLFIKIKDLNQPLKKLEKEILDLQKKDIQYYKIEAVHKEVSTKTLESETTFFSFKECEPFELKTAKFFKDIVLKQSIFSSTELCLLSENKLVAANYFEKKLIILKNLHINTRSNDVMDMPSFPQGITKVEDNKAAITFPDEAIVRMITFSDSMPMISTDVIPVGICCCGIAYCNNNLIVSYLTNPGKVQILNMSGKVLKCFDKDNKGKFLFYIPQYLTLSPDNTIIYVSDWKGRTVTSMTLGGQVKAIHKDDKLQGPCQLTVDETGAVFVCGQFSENVHLLSPDLSKGKILLAKSEGLSRPCGIAYCQKNNRLYVGMSDRIKVFNVSRV